MPRIRFGPRSRISPWSPGAHRDAASRARRCGPRCPRTAGRSCRACRGGRSTSRRAPQYGPNGLGHAEEVGARPGRGRRCRRQDRGEAAGPQRRQIGGGEGRVRRRCAPPGRASRGTGSTRSRSRKRERARRLRRRLGQQRRARDEHREQPAAEAARPEERHRDVQPLVRRRCSAPRARPPWPAARCRGCGSRPSARRGCPR